MGWGGRLGSHFSRPQLSIVRAQEDIRDHRTRALISSHPAAPPGWTAGHTPLPGHVGSRLRCVSLHNHPTRVSPGSTEAGGPSQPTMKEENPTRRTPRFCGPARPAGDTAGAEERSRWLCGLGGEPSGWTPGPGGWGSVGSRGLPHLSGPSGLASPLPGHPQLGGLPAPSGMVPMWVLSPGSSRRSLLASVKELHQRCSGSPWSFGTVGSARAGLVVLVGGLA